MMEEGQQESAGGGGSNGQSRPASDALPIDAGTDVQCCFETLALPYIDAVNRFARALARDAADADDLVQETFLRAFRGWHTFRPGSDPRRWLFTICHNIFRRNSRRPTELRMEQGDPGLLSAMIVSDREVYDGTDEILNRIFLGEALRNAIEQLEETFRLVVVLVDCEGYTYQEVAELLSVPVGTVRSRLFRARRNLQETLFAHARDIGLVGNGNRTLHHPDGRSGRSCGL